MPDRAQTLSLGRTTNLVAVFGPRVELVYHCQLVDVVLRTWVMSQGRLRLHHGFLIVQ